MIKVRSIRVLDSKFNILVIKYPDDLRFTDEIWAEKFRANETKKWAMVFETDVVVDIDFLEIPRQVNVLNICQHTAGEMGVSLKALFGKTKQRDVTEAKMFAVNIMLDAGIPVAHIEEHTPFKNRIYYYYQTRLQGLRDTDSGVDSKYKSVYDRVMKKMMK